MTWDNGEGLVFTKEVAVDDNYMFTVTRRVTNNGSAPVTLDAYALISRWGTPVTSGYYILHEGPIGALGGKLEEINYKDLAKPNGDVKLTSTGGWIGIGDKYWLASLVPDQQSAITANFRYTPKDGQPRYQVDYAGAPMTVAPGASVEITDRLF